MFLLEGTILKRYTLMPCNVTISERDVCFFVEYFSRRLNMLIFDLNYLWAQVEILNVDFFTECKIVFLENRSCNFIKKLFNFNELFWII